MKKIYIVALLVLLSVGFGNYYFSKKMEGGIVTNQKDIKSSEIYSEKIKIEGREFRVTPQQKRIYDGSNIVSLLVAVFIFLTLRLALRSEQAQGA